MGDTHDKASGVSIRPARYGGLGSLRYFDAAGGFAADAAAALGGPLPRALRVATYDESAGIVLAWRSPTEALVLCSDASVLAALESRLADRTDGCLVDQTGGILAYELTGDRVPDLIARLGASTAIPAPGEARTSRLAEITVTAFCLRSGIVLLVERVLAPHLMEWIRAVSADL